MSEELETMKQIATHPVSLTGAAAAVFTWLANKVWSGYRHEINNIKHTQENYNSVLWKELDRRIAADTKLLDLFMEHDQLDRERFDKSSSENRDRHDELLVVIGDLRADIAGLKR